MSKLGLFENETTTPYTYPNVWARERTTGADRLVIAPAFDLVKLLHALSACMQEPFGLLYVLIVSRIDSSPGRYQDPEPLGRLQMLSFLESYSDFLEGDARHSFWIMSVADRSLLIYDQHNVIYAYGPLEKFEAILKDAGLKEAAEVRFPAPHTHFYNQEFDSEEARILKEFNWIHSPLRLGDDL
jgi:hypothetical protein